MKFVQILVRKGRLQTDGLSEFNLTTCIAVDYLYWDKSFHGDR